MKPLISILFVVCSITLFAQENGFPFGKTVFKDFQSTFPSDSSAVAVVIDEFGEGFFDNGNDNNLLYFYHVKIKILKTEGLKYADIEIPLYKNDTRAEKLLSAKASSFNVEDQRIREVPLNPKSIFTENRGKYYD